MVAVRPAAAGDLQGFLANPKLVWDWYQYRLGLVENALPDSGHLAIAESE